MGSVDPTRQGIRPDFEPISLQQQHQASNKRPNSSRDALCKLRAQRLQQRQLQAQQSSAPHLHGAPRPPPANGRAPAAGSRIQYDQPRPQQQRTLAGPAARRLTTTAVSGMQTRPPSRTSSARGSPEPAAPATAAIAATSSGRCSAAATTRKVSRGCRKELQPNGPQQQQHLQPKQQPKQECTALPSQDGVRHTLSVQGVAVNLPQAAAAPALPGRSGVGQCAAAVATCGGMLLGCGAAWGQLAAHAGAVARRSLLVGRQEQQQHRMLLARVVTRQWRWFVVQQRQQHAAVAHSNRRLLLAGWSGLQQEAQAQRLLLGRAQQLATKHSFLLLSRCFTAWQQWLLQQRRQQALLVAFRSRQQRVVAHRVLRGWRLQVLAQRRQEQLLLRAEAHHTLSSMVKALQGWAGWLRDEQVMRLKASRATSHWHEVLQRRGLRAWRLAVAAAVEELYCLARALSFHRQKQLARALRGWAAAAAAQQQARQRLLELLHQWQQRHQLHTLRVAVRCWLALVQQRALLRQLHELLVGQLQQRRKRKVLLHWLQLHKYRKQLAVAAAGMGDVGSWWWQLQCWQRWRCVVAAMQGRRGEELRQLVQLRACIGTWLEFTERQRRQRLRLAAAQATLRVLKLRQLLPAWREVAQQLQHKRQQKALAQLHFVQRRRRQLLLLWQGNAADAAVERIQLAAAVEMHSRWLASRAFGAWINLCCYRDLKRRALPWHHHKLQLKALQSWRQYVERKRLRRQQAQRAERHWQLALLARAVAAWRAALLLAAQKQQLLQQAVQHYERQQLQRAMQAWRGPFLQLKRHKRGQRQQADAMRWHTLLRHGLAAWKAAVAAHRAQQQQLMLWAFEAWQLALQQSKQERLELAVAAAPAERALAARCARRVLLNWRRLTAQQQQERAAVAVADGFRHRLQLQLGLRGWRLYQRHRHLRAAAAERAWLHRRSVLSSAVMHGLRAAVSAGRAKRLRLVSAALMRRQWLLSRAYRAWRLASAMATMERAASWPGSTQQPVARPSSGSTALSNNLLQQQQQQQQPQQQPGASLDAIAAAVVAASCASHTKWQQQWRRQWQETSDTSQPDQLPPMVAAVASDSSSSVLIQGPSQPADSQQQQQQQQAGKHEAACTTQQPAALLLPGDAAAQQQQWRQPVVGGGRTARRPPRLPAFMRAELQQPQEQQQQARAAWQQDQPQQEQQQQSSTSWPSVAGAALASQLSTGRKQRPQPRQLPAAFLAAGPGPRVPAQVARRQHLPHQPAAVFVCGQPQAVALHGAGADSAVHAAAAHLTLGTTGLASGWQPPLPPPPPQQQQQQQQQPVSHVELAQEMSAMESAVQACRHLEATVQLRQQQIAALQERLAAAVLARGGPGSAEAGVLGLQLRDLQAELRDLLAEQSLQQPRLAGMMQRIQQLRAAAARGVPAV